MSKKKGVQEKDTSQNSDQDPLATPQTQDQGSGQQDADQNSSSQQDPTTQEQTDTDPFAGFSTTELTQQMDALDIEIGEKRQKRADVSSAIMRRLKKRT